MSPTDSYDVFISYRRSRGAQAARLIQAYLLNAEYRVFLDVDNLADGHFDDKLLETISNTPSFVAILSPDAFERGYDDSDWFYKEIDHAIATERKIIPIMMPGFEYPCIDSCPLRLQQIKRHNALVYSHNYFGATMARLEEYLGLPRRVEIGKTGIHASSRDEVLPETNPYLNRCMIRSAGEFFGRQREVRAIMSRIDASHPQSISVVGDRMMGKSSLLNYCCSRSTRERFLSHPTDTAMAYIDLQGVAGRSPQDFCQQSHLALQSDSPDFIPDGAQESTNLDHIRAMIEEMEKKGKRIVLLVDEFEVAMQRDRFNAGFFSYLRSLANMYRFAMMTASSVDLQELTVAEDISDSPFFNIFSNLRLRAFTHNEAMALVRTPSADNERPLEPYADKLLGLSGLHPLFIQIACAAAFDALGNNTPFDFDIVTMQFMEEAEPHHEFFWSHLSRTQAEVMTGLASNRQPSSKNRFLVEQLQHLGFVISDGNGSFLISEGMKRFILKKREKESRPGWIKRFFRR